MRYNTKFCSWRYRKNTAYEDTLAQRTSTAHEGIIRSSVRGNTAQKTFFENTTHKLTDMKVHKNKTKNLYKTNSNSITLKHKILPTKI